jgi:hypothetical protein
LGNRFKLQKSRNGIRGNDRHWRKSRLGNTGKCNSATAFLYHESRESNHHDIGENENLA